MIARKSTLIITTRIIEGILTYTALFFITKYMQPEAYGTVMFAMGFVALFAILPKIFNHAHVKKISAGKQKDRCIGTYLILEIISIIVFIAASIATLLFWTNILNRGFETPAHEIAIVIMIAYWAVRSIAVIINTTFRATKEIACNQTTTLISVLFRLALILFVAFNGYGPIGLALAYVGGEIVMILSGIFFFHGRHHVGKPSKKLAKEYIVFSIPIVFVVISSMVIKNIDQVIIQLFWTAEDVGYYASAYRITLFLKLFISAVGILLFPTYSKYHADNNHDAIKKLTYDSERWLSMLLFPMIFGMMFLAEPATKILLNRWMGAAVILQYLPLYVLFMALETPYQNQFLGMNHPKLARNRVLIMVSLNIILDIFLVPTDIQSIGITGLGLGAKGAVIATITAYGAGLIYSRLVSYRLTGAKGNWRILLHFLAATIMIGAIHIITQYIQIERFYHLLFIAIIGFSIYMLTLALMKEFDKKDWNFVIDTLNIKKMFKYIKEELQNIK